MTKSRTLPLLLIAASLLLAGCNDKKADQQQAPGRPVQVQKVAFEPLVPARSFAGTIRPRIETDQAFRVPGKVTARLVQVGDKVKAGQILARLDSADLGLQQQQAQAEFDAARGALAQASAEEKRQASLRASGWSASALLERAQAAAAEARGRVTRAERALELAGNALGYAELAATADGVVTATSIEPGQVVAAGQAAIRIAQLDEKEAVVAIPEMLVDRARTAQASVSLWSDPGQSYKAVLREFSPSADPATRTYLARFSIAKPSAEMELGMTATVTLTEATGMRVARLPLSALFSQNDKPSLWLADEKTGALRLVPVEVSAYDSRSVLVKSGVKDGDLVVTLGVQKLDAGQRVRIVENRF